MWDRQRRHCKKFADQNPRCAPCTTSATAAHATTAPAESDGGPLWHNFFDSKISGKTPKVKASRLRLLYDSAGPVPVPNSDGFADNFDTYNKFLKFPPFIPKKFSFGFLSSCSARLAGASPGWLAKPSWFVCGRWLPPLGFERSQQSPDPALQPRFARSLVL